MNQPQVNQTDNRNRETPAADEAPFGEAELTALREKVSGGMSPKRFRHTAEVEKMTARLCALYCPEKTTLLRAAALLHDITKELSLFEQLGLCQQLGVPREAGDELAPKCFHAKTAAALIPVMYPTFNIPVIVNAVRWHTTGHEDMTLTEKLVYLADYIDESRTFPDCVRLRSLFWDADPESMDADARLAHLRDVMIMSYDMTISALLAEGVPVSPDTMLARNRLLLEKHRDAQSKDRACGAQ